jgi:hypothetical protein
MGRAPFQILVFPLNTRNANGVNLKKRFLCFGMMETRPRFGSWTGKYAGKGRGNRGNKAWPNFRYYFTEKQKLWDSA